MFSPIARSLLHIPAEESLPTNLAIIYDQYVAGQSYETRFRSGWSFGPRGSNIEEGYDSCLEELTAQCHFYLNSALGVFVEADKPVQIASTFISLVEMDAILVASRATGASRRGFGQFPSMDAFLATHGSYLQGWDEAPFADTSFGRYFLGPRSVVELSRFYSDDFLISAIEYF